jgi:hypothetical protein
LNADVVAKIQHRWKGALDDYIRVMLEQAAERLSWAWAVDVKYPKSFPVNTDSTLFQIKNEIREYQSNGPPEPEDSPQEPERAHKGIKLLRPSEVRRLFDVVNETTIRVAYESQNAGTYEEALKVAAEGGETGSAAFRKVLNAVRLGYDMCRYGEDVAPMPKLQYLHRELLAITDLVDELREMTPKGIAEFLEDVCPCGKKHGPEAIRKLRKRRAKISGTKQ